MAQICIMYDSARCMLLYYHYARLQDVLRSFCGTEPVQVQPVSTSQLIVLSGRVSGFRVFHCIGPLNSQISSMSSFLVILLASISDGLGPGHPPGERLLGRVADDLGATRKRSYPSARRRSPFRSLFGYSCCSMFDRSISAAGGVRSPMACIANERACEGLREIASPGGTLNSNHHQELFFPRSPQACGRQEVQ